MSAGHLSRRTLGRMAMASAALAPFGRALAQARLSVAAVNYPLAYFAERLAGDLADIVFPIPAGTDPSFWRPGIADITAFQSADLILLNGANFADWTARTTLPRSRLVQTSSGFEDAFIATETITHSHGDGGEHSHTGTASYVWLDFGQAEQQADAILRALSRAAPDAEDAFAGNHAALVADLRGLAAEAAELGERAENMTLITSHPRYQYFGRAYGVTFEAVDWDIAEPPSEPQWQELAALARQHASRIFVWEGTPTAAATARIEAMGLANVLFPPLASRPDDGDFITVMQASLSGLRQAIEVAAQG